MNQPRILYFSSLFPSPVEPHTGVFALRRAQALASAGCAVRVIRPVGLTPPMSLGTKPIRALKWTRERLAIPRRANLEGVEVLYPKWAWPPKAVIGGYYGHVLYAQLARRLRQEIDQFRPDAIVASWLPDAAAACLAARRSGVPAIAVAEGSDLVYLPSKYPFWSPMRNALNLASAVVCVSDGLAVHAGEAGLTAPVRTVHNGVDTVLFDVDGPREGDRLPRILSVGWLTQVKSHETLLRAAQLLMPSFDGRLRIQIVGEGPLRDHLSALGEELGIAGQVEILGQRSQRDLVELYQRTDVFCLPSISEGLGCVLLEAMACGTPVVASRVGGVPEVVTDQVGLLVPPSQPAALAGALDQAIRRTWDPLAVRQHVVDHFTWSKTAERLLTVVHEARQRKAASQ